MKLKRDEVISLIYNRGPLKRFTQDSPVLPDVWAGYAADPGNAQDVLLTPHLDPKAMLLTPGMLCQALEKMLAAESARSPKFKRAGPVNHQMAYNQATVVTRLWFDELVRVILPLSCWWADKVQRDPKSIKIEELHARSVQEQIARLLADAPQKDQRKVEPDLLWMIRVAGTIALARRTNNDKRSSILPSQTEEKDDRKRVAYYLRVVQALADLLVGISATETPQALIHLVSLNRKATASIWRSGPAVKADAARSLFNIHCSDLCWGIIDSGIDAQHPAFLSQIKEAAQPEQNGANWWERSRVVATYDFTIIRNLLSTDPALMGKLPRRIKQRLQSDPDLRRNLRYRLQTGHDIDWSLLKDLIRVPHENGYKPPVHEHGTHVAGILGGDWLSGKDGNPENFDVKGICPDIHFYDLRVMNDQGEGDEFSVMAALQFIRYLNAHQDYMVLHGVNLSLSIAHDVRNYACGGTPVCEECARLIGSGVVVVVAAGNEGYRKAAPDGEERYENISVTDPGNAEDVITVGSTHRDAPHTYGVSYFSSRGPTGDGGVKPDLVAPGEKIESTIPGKGLKRLDGTSMAAPHVSGVAALLMARHRELVGHPQRIKQILCETATDLGRERYFQGCGLVDALRALQSV